MKKILAFLFVVLSMMSFSVNAASTVKVKVAPFYTEIQYMSVDNRYVEYPLITYKDITYFPMTFDLCTNLGLVCGFDSEKGLFITREYVDQPEESNPFGKNAVNSYEASYDAVIPTYPIYLNGVYIDNTKEEFPLLNFRGVTYFPMTWRFAYEELNFDIEWSEKDYSFKLYDAGRSSVPWACGVDGNIVKLHDSVDVYSESINEYGDTRYTFEYSYYKHYDFDTLAQSVTFKGDSEKGVNTQMPERQDKITPIVVDASVKEKRVYIGDTLLINLDGEESVNGASVTEYKLGDSSLLYLSAQIGTAPAPYTQFKGYFFSKDSSGIKQIPWDERNIFRAVYPDNKGGFYIATYGFRPAYSGRWANSFSDIYYYTPGAEEFQSVTQKHADLFNSMQALGASGSKLYVQAMWYDAEKERYNGGAGVLFSAVNSGFYILDMTTGELKKLYPYICGETFFGPDNKLYCISKASRVPKIVNITDGNTISIE